MDKEKKREYGRRFYQRHKERLREIGNAYYRTNKEHIGQQRRDEYHGEKREKLLEYSRRYVKEHREQERLKARKYYWAHQRGCLFASKLRRIEDKRKVIELLGSKCRRCSNSDIRVLQVNHINGGGTSELAKRQFYRWIVLGKRRTDDLELLCANCNVIYEYERGYRK